MRPLSPHVEIYKFPITAISSITNRITGLACTGMYIGTGIMSYKTNPIDLYRDLDWKLKKVVNYSILFPVNYHTLCGFRHFIWDKYPNLLTNTKVGHSSICVFGASIIGTVLVERGMFRDFF